MKKNFLIYFLLLLNVSIIIALGILFYKNYTYTNELYSKLNNLNKQVDQLENANTNTSYTNSTSQELPQESSSKENDKKTQTISSTEKSNTELIKERLKNQDWIDKNIKMKKSCFVGIDITGEQTSKFMQISTGNDCAVIVETESDSDVSKDAFIVSCKNGQVIVNSLPSGPVHNSHNGIYVSSTNKIVLIDYMHMDLIEKTYYSIENNEYKLTERVGYGTRRRGSEDQPEEETIYFKNTSETPCSKEEYDNINNKYKNMNFQTIDNDLTSNNIDKLIQ